MMINKQLRPIFSLKILTFLLLGSFFAPSLFAEKGTQIKPKISTKGVQATLPVNKETPLGTSKVLYSGWYTVTVGDNLKWGYYNDRFEQKDGRFFVQNHFWKKSEKSISEEHLGAFVDESFKPLFFNFQGFLTNGSPLRIDGTAQADGSLSIRVKKGTQEAPIIQKQIKGNYFFSGIFPLWLRKNLKLLSEGGTGKSLTFQTVMEDNIESGFDAIPGTVQLEKEDSFAKSTKTKKLSVSYQVKSVWYLDAEGWPVRIETLTNNPEESTLVDRVSEETAKKFLTQ